MAREPLPGLELERALWAQGLERVAGVDEVGRGCLSGPVLAAAVVMPRDCRPIPGVRDSKVLTTSQRCRLDGEVRRQALAVALGAASVREVERLNVRRAAYLAMRRALARLGGCEHALLDGPEPREDGLGPHTAVIDGDARCYSIACASIVAKVARDALMARLAGRYPGYGWEHNAGYGTRAHVEALRRLGASPLHRRQFGPVRALLEEAGD